MSRFDVLRSLLRSGAIAASEHARKLPITAALTQAIEQAQLTRARIDDAALTAAIARGHGVAAATVRAGQGKLRIDASFDDGSALRIALWPSHISFAPLGAKEVGFGIEPREALSDPRAQDVCAALATEIAHAVWRSVLGPAKAGEAGAFVSRDGDKLIADLRSVPAVRRAKGNKLLMAVIEALRPQTIEVADGELRIAMMLGV
jgi:hypothetical protein